MVKIQGLDELMRQKQASNEDLAEQSGLSTSTIARARLGHLIKDYSAELIFETLETREFAYKKSGPKPQPLY